MASLNSSAQFVSAVAGTSPSIQRKTAILVIHGIGEQLPFATLDQFAQGFIRYLTPGPAGSANGWPYTLTQQTTLADNDRGCDFCLRLQHPHSTGYLDLHEYYWAHHTEQQISLAEISDWLYDALQAFNSYYSENKALQERYERDNPTRKITKLGWLRWGVRVWRIAQLIDAVVAVLPTPVARSLRAGASAILPAKLLTSYVGDVVAYTTSNRKSRLHSIRNTILCGALSKLQTLLGGKDYDQVLIAGHSLGSVIGYDILNRTDLLCNFPDQAPLQAQLSKLKAFVTFGSPLDKVYFFLREQAAREEFVKRQLLDNLRLLRKHAAVAPQSIAITTSPNLKTFLSAQNLPWHNFYHDNDDVSGHLDFYTDVDNIKVSFQTPEDNNWARAHGAYWTHEPLYKKLLEYVLP